MLVEGRRFTILISHGLKMFQSSVIMIYVSVVSFFFSFKFDNFLKFINFLYPESGSQIHEI